MAIFNSYVKLPEGKHGDFPLRSSEFHYRSSPWRRLVPWLPPPRTSAPATLQRADSSRSPSTCPADSRRGGGMKFYTVHGWWSHTLWLCQNSYWTWFVHRKMGISWGVYSWFNIAIEHGSTNTYFYGTIMKYNLSHRSYFIPFISVSWAITVHGWWSHTLWLCQNSYWTWPSRNSWFTH